MSDLISDPPAKHKVGDWVRWNRGGTLAIGEVRYVHEAPFPKRPCVTYTTDNGVVEHGDVLEVRGPA